MWERLRGTDWTDHGFQARVAQETCSLKRTWEISGCRSFVNNIPPHRLRRHFQAKDGYKIHGPPGEGGYREPTAPRQLQQKRWVYPEPHMAPHHQNAPTNQKLTNGKERIGAGRTPTPPTCPRTRPIYVTTENNSTHQTLMLKTVMIIETSVQYIHLRRLLAREDYIKFIRRESTETDT
jgi:hypothetical protein